MPDRPRVFGLDLSLTATGIAAPDGSTFTVPTNRDDGDRRLTVIRDRVIRHVYDDGSDQQAELVVIEAPFATMGGSTVKLAMVQGAVRCALIDAGIPYVLVAPTAVKRYATGKGGGAGTDKGSMRMALYKRTGIDLADDNQVDAMWCRLIGLDLLGHPEYDMPAANRTALERLTPA